MELVVFLATFLLSSIILIILRNRKMNSSALLMPPSLPSLPLIGSLPFIGGFDNMAKFYMKKSKQLGPIFTFKIGRSLCLVLNNLEAIREALVGNSLAFAGREALAIERLWTNKRQKGIGFKNFDATWRRYHKLSLSILKEFGFGDKRIMESRILTEVDALIAFLRTKRNEAFNPRDTLSQATSNIIMNISLGCRDDYESEICDMACFTEKTAKSADPLLDIAPLLRFIPYFKQRFNNCGINNTKLVNAIDEYIKGMDAVSTDCFVTRYIEKEGPDYDHEQLLFIIRDFSLGGTTTTATTLSWSFLLLANNLSVQKRVQQEIDDQVPRDRLPNLDDKSKLLYVEATILEIMRYRALIPLSLPRVTLKDCKVGGYFIPTGTMVLTNIYAAHMDPDSWKDPEIFLPERFLNDAGDISDNENVISFSLGRRSCLGEDLARQELFLFFSGIFQNFNILPQDNQKWIDDKEVCGVIHEPKPFKIRILARD